MEEVVDRLLRDVSRTVTDAGDQISDAVRQLEAGQQLEAESLLGEAMSRLQIVASEVDRHLEGRGGRGLATGEATGEATGGEVA